MLQEFGNWKDKFCIGRRGICSQRRDTAKLNPVSLSR
jgi:hypothetical protein